MRRDVLLPFSVIPFILHRGLILTNRHVVSTGPVTMHVIFPQTQEEIEVR